MQMNSMMPQLSSSPPLMVIPSMMPVFEEDELDGDAGETAHDVYKRIKDGDKNLPTPSFALSSDAQKRALSDPDHDSADKVTVGNTFETNLSSEGQTEQAVKVDQSRDHKNMIAIVGLIVTVVIIYELVQLYKSREPVSVKGRRK